MEQPTVLSLKVSRAPFSASPLLPRSASYPGYKILAEFLDKKRMQYIVMAERNKSSRHEQGGAKSSSQHAVNFERDSEKLIVERVVLKAKTNLKSKRKNSRERKKRSLISELCHHTGPNINKPSNQVTTHLRPAERLLRNRVENQSDISLPNFCPQYCTTTQIYHGLLYKQVENQWKASLQHKKQLPKVVNKNGKSPTALNFQKCIDEKRKKLTTAVSTANYRPTAVLPNKATGLKSFACEQQRSQPIAAVDHKKSTTGSQKGPRLDKEVKKTKQEIDLLRAKQRLEIYALNKIMRELEETKFMEAIANKV